MSDRPDCAFWVCQTPAEHRARCPAGDQCPSRDETTPAPPQQAVSERTLAEIIEARIRADERARIAAEIEAHADAIGWYESSGTWAEAIALAAGTHHSPPSADEVAAVLARRHAADHQQRGPERTVGHCLNCNRPLVYRDGRLVHRDGGKSCAGSTPGDE